MALSGLPKRKRDKACIIGFTEHRQVGFNLPRDQYDFFSLNELYRYPTWTKENKGSGYDANGNWALDIWLKNNGPESVKDQFDFWYEIHDRVENLETTLDGKVHVETLKHFPIPVFTNEPWPDVPNAVLFPKEEVEKACGTEYFTSTPAWMIGLCIAMGYKEIQMHGIDMAQDTEYFEQRPCVEHLLGIAQGKGIKVVLPPTSDICKAVGQYGFGKEGGEFRLKLQERLAWLNSQDNEYLTKIRALDAEYNKKTADLEAQYRDMREKLLVQRSQCYGAIQDCEFWMRSWSIGAMAPKDQPIPDRTKDPALGITAPPSGGERKELPQAA